MKKTILHPTKRFDNALSEDIQIRIDLESNEKIIRNDDRNVILNLSQQYFNEKNSCINYKIFGKLRMVFRNLYEGFSEYSYLRNRLSLTDIINKNKGYLPYNEYAFRRNDIYGEANTGVTISDFDNFTGFTLTTTGSNSHLEINSTNYNKHNWNLYLSYVYSGVTNFPMKYTLSGITQPHISFLSGDGIPFRVEQNDSYIILTSPVKHGMLQGEHIIVSGVPFYINSVGNEIYNSELYTIYISKSQIKNNFTFNSLITGKRCVDIKNSGETTSQYYVHKLKTLTDINDYDIDNIGFESTIFEEEKKIIFETYDGDNDVIVERNRMEVLMYNFKDPFVLSGITNNFNNTPSEIYLTTIFNNGNGYFLFPPKVGYSFHFHNSWVDLHFSGNTSNETSLSSYQFNRDSKQFSAGLPLNINTDLYGDFIEFNPSEMKERIISPSYHKISINPSFFDHGQTGSTFYSGSSVNNPTGLYYQTHYKIKLKELSPYVEVSKTNNVYNLPENARYFENEKIWKWRDIYDLGYFDEQGNGVDFSFMNNMLYVHKDINFYLRNEKQFKNKIDGLKNFKNLSSTSDIVC